ncbi:putative molibdopterin-dependent oxidoreductase YjgC [Desulfitispora alkaliphila]
MSKITLSIDGVNVTVPQGTTVLEAAKAAGFDIPTLCHDPSLSNPGACRLCVVEIEGMRNLPASCVTTVNEGMIVKTKSEDVLEARKVILELLLANHPQDCMTCERTGNCKLQDYAYQYGVRELSVSGEQTEYPLDNSNQFMERDNSKCILCGKCVRACAEVPERNVLDFTERGFNTKVTTALDVAMEETDCVFCGTCVAVCPVGALVPKMMKGQGRPWETEKVLTTCPYCGTGCNLELVVKDHKVIGVESTPEAEVNGNALCVKGRFGYNFIHHPDRLQTPLVRKEGELKPATWEEAVDYVAEKLGAIKEESGPDAIAALSSARCTNEENFLMNKFMRAVIGTNNLDHCARL